MEWWIPKLSLKAPLPTLRHVICSLKSRCEWYHPWFVSVKLFALVRMLLQLLCSLAGQFLSPPHPPISAYQGHKNDPRIAGQLYVSVGGIFQMLAPEPLQNLSTISLLCSRLPVNEIGGLPGEGFRAGERKHWEEVGGSAQHSHQSRRQVFSAHDSKKRLPFFFLPPPKKIIKDEGNKMSFSSMRSRFLNPKVEHLVWFFNRNFFWWGGVF